MAQQDYREPFARDRSSLDSLLEKCRSYFNTALDTIDEQFVVSSAANSVYFSNAIEKEGCDMEETHKLISGEQIWNDSKPHLEVLQHYAVLRRAMKSGHARELLSAQRIRQWHHDLMEYILVDAGQYRLGGVTAGEKVFVSHELVPELVERLVEQWHQIIADATLSPFAAAAWLSFTFVNIHPFNDGNGHLSRILGNYVLAYFGFPFAVSITTKRTAYIASIRYADKQFDGVPRTGALAYLLLKDAASLVDQYKATLL